MCTKSPSRSPSQAADDPGAITHHSPNVTRAVSCRSGRLFTTSINRRPVLSRAGITGLGGCRTSLAVGDQHQWFATSCGLFADCRRSSSTRCPTCDWVGDPRTVLPGLDAPALPAAAALPTRLPQPDGRRLRGRILASLINVSLAGNHGAVSRGETGRRGATRAPTALRPKPS